MIKSICFKITWPLCRAWIEGKKEWMKGTQLWGIMQRICVSLQILYGDTLILKAMGLEVGPLGDN